MYISSAIMKKVSKSGSNIVIPRDGVCKEVLLPDDIEAGSLVDINIVGRSAVFSYGKSAFILTDEFDIILGRESVYGTMFFIKDGIALELEYGKVVVGGEYIVDSEFNTTKLSKEENLYRITNSKLRSDAEYLIKDKYSLSNKEESSYVDNLVFNVEISATGTGKSPCIGVRFLTLFRDISLNEFPFVDYSFKGSTYRSNDVEEDDE